MGATTSAPATPLSVTPGDQVRTEITVRNSGRVVDAYSFEPLGTLAPWMRVEPESLALDNVGNTAVEVFFAGGDPEHALDVLMVPDHVTLAPGSAAVVAVRPRARERFWKGQPTSHPYQVVTEPAGQQPVVVDGTLLQ